MNCFRHGMLAKEMECIEYNYTWLAAELSALLEFLGQEKEKNRNLSAKLHQLCGTVSRVHLVKDQPKWEKILHALLHIAEPDKKEDVKDVKRVADQRLIWLFNHSAAQWGQIFILDTAGCVKDKDLTPLSPLSSDDLTCV